MKNISLVFCLGLTIAICCAWMKKDPVRPDQFVGKWFIADYKVNGVTDPDAVYECDSSTYIIRSDGTFTYCRVWYMRCADTTFVCGNWEYYEKKNQLHFNWTTPTQKRTEKWPLKSNDATTIVTGNSTLEIHFRKVQ